MATHKAGPARLIYHVFYVEFAAMKLKSFNFAKQNLENGVSDSEYYSKAMEKYAEGISTILFAALALEAMSYEFCVEWFGENFTRDNLDRTSPVTRWIIALKMKHGKTFIKGESAYQQLHAVFKIRDKLVHRKGIKHDPSAMGPDIAALNDEWVLTAIKALREVPKAAYVLTKDVLFLAESSRIDDLFKKQ